jgi:hypothetical protein
MIAMRRTGLRGFDALASAGSSCSANGVGCGVMAVIALEESD